MKTISVMIMSVVAAFFVMPTLAQAQYSVEPRNGDLLRLDSDNFWHVTTGETLRLEQREKIAEDVDSPSISPDGKRVIVHRKPEAAGQPGKLFQWADAERTVTLLREDLDVSNYVTWTDNDRFFMREQQAPFFEHGKKLNFAVEGRRTHFRSKRAINENAVLVYQMEDAIIMKRENVIQVISDVTRDRYFSPIVSADEKFIVFVGLTSGINLFDIAQNAVVYQDSLGAYPSFSADGRYLIYTQARDDGHVLIQTDTLLIDLHHQRVIRVANPEQEIRVRATISRDASYMAFETASGEVFRAKLAL